MALSLEDVIGDIYDAYKITEDEQIKQGILKKRIHIKDFLPPLRDQLKGLNDEELLAVSALLKDTMDHYVSYTQNGVVNINIPQSVINQGIDNAKFRRRGVSGVSLEHESIAETAIKTAGTVGIAELYGEHIKPEEIQHLFGGLDMDTAIAIARSIDHAEFAANNVPDFKNNIDAMHVIFNNLPFGGIIDSESFFDNKKVSPEDRVLLFANMSKFFKFIEIVGFVGFDKAINSNKFQELLQSGLTLEKLAEMGFSQEVITDMSMNPEIKEKFNENLNEKQDFYRQPEVRAIFREEITQIIQNKYPNMSQSELEQVLNNPLLKDVILNSFGLDGKGGFAYSPELIAASIGKIIEIQRNNESKNSIPTYNYNDITDKQKEHLIDSDNDVVSSNSRGAQYDSSNTEDSHRYYSTSQQTTRQRLNYAYNRYKSEKDRKNTTEYDRTNISNQPYIDIYSSPDSSVPQMQVDGYTQDDATSFFIFNVQKGSFDLRATDDKLADFDDSSLDDPTFTEYEPNAVEIQQAEAEGPLSDRTENMLVDEEFRHKATYKQDNPTKTNENTSINSSERSNESPSTDSSSSASSSTSSNNTGLIKSGNKSAATVGGFWSNFMRHMREDKESKGLIRRIRSAYRKAREDRDKELGFAKDEPTEVSNSESPVEEPTFDDRYKVDMSGKSTPIAPQPEKTTTDTKSRDPEEPTQGPDDPTL